MYNKAEALQEKEVAEKLINAADYVSARDRLIKAQQLFPSLDHIVGMLTVCDVLSASKTKIPGYDIDYYWILRLMPSCNFTDINCRHQKLHKSMIPIKNKFPGTELALKLIEDAFSVLSDADKRSAFDSKRKSSWEGYESVNEDSALGCGVSNREAVISAQIFSGYGKVSSGEISEGKKWNVEDWAPELHVNNLEEPSACSSTVNSEGNTLEEIDMPVDDEEDLNWFDQEFYNFGCTRTLECFETGQIWAAAHYQSDEPQNRRYAQINAVLTSTVVVTWLKPVPISDGERRWCDAGLPVASGPFHMDLENSEKVISPTAFSYICTWVHGITEEQFEIYPKKGEVWALYEDWDLDEWSYNRETVKGCKFKLVEFLSDFSKYLGADIAHLVKADGFNSIFQRIRSEGNHVVLHISPNNLYMLSHRVPEHRFTGGEIDGVIEGMLELDQLALPNETVNDIYSQPTSKVENSDSSNKSDCSNCNAGQVPFLSSLKPYPDSKILGPNWSPNDFIAGQVWAVYDEKDLPRHYTQINTVISSNQVRVTYLEPQPILDYEFAWKKERLPVVCGVYGATGPNVNLDRSHFSHLVRCQRSTTNPIYKVYPVKGEIWAMYKNWNNKWKQFQYENAEFDFVEILSDLSEGSGMRIAKLVEVEGCLTFFQRRQLDGFDLSRVVLQSEVVGFSHRIPAFRVPGIGQHGIPESSWHLEPNALPCKRESEA
ncbi:hypothetical protein RHSIM_Rhsim08G0196500 [Rhododendron simsii]|uniref:DNAJ heat shock N-terminal domain-containing protein n=1 Tax=Rhododendron simsii TaxID=118357 RepID=A0A834LDB4_RHOSS|nr:hypothetical protein RHSIM_Rhsim08G0196500 [Rhododendron simsii]